jgi:hypothetical protein
MRKYFPVGSAKSCAFWGSHTIHLGISLLNPSNIKAFYCGTGQINGPQSALAQAHAARFKNQFEAYDS